MNTSQVLLFCFSFLWDLGKINATLIEQRLNFFKRWSTGRRGSRVSRGRLTKELAIGRLQPTFFLAHGVTNATHRTIFAITTQMAGVVVLVVLKQKSKVSWWQEVTSQGQSRCVSKLLFLSAYPHNNHNSRNTLHR